MSLRSLQLELVDAIFSNAPVETITPPEHVAVYQQTITAHLIAALKETYPLIVQLLGDDFFYRSAQEYIQRYPSCSSNLHDFGEYFSDFIATDTPVQSLLYLPDVAQFEWACHRLSFSAETTHTDLRLLATVSPDDYQQLRFTLPPASQLFSSRYPLFAIIDLCQGKREAPVDLQEGGVHLLLIRRDLEIVLVSLSLAEFNFLTDLNHGLSLAKAFDRTRVIDEHFNLEEKLPAFIRDKIIVGVLSG